MRQSMPDSGLGCQVEVLENVWSCSLFARKRKGTFWGYNPVPDDRSDYTVRAGLYALTAETTV